MPLPIVALAEGDVIQAAAYLAARQADVRSRGLDWHEKRANGLSDVLSGIGSKVSENPILGKALIGGGLGAVAGAGTHLLGGGDTDEEGRPRRRGGLLGKALTGGLAGAALGGGLGAAQQFWPGGGGGGGGGGKLGPGEFVHGGSRYRIDPEILRKHPELLRRASEAAAGPGLLSPGRLVGQGVQGVMFNPWAPISGLALPAYGAYDIASSYKNRQMEDLRRGLTEILGEGKNRPELTKNQQAMEQLLGNEADMRGVLARQRTSPHGANALKRWWNAVVGRKPTADFQTTHPVTRKEWQWPKPTGAAPPTGTGAINPVEVTVPTSEMQHVPRAIINEARTRGYNARPAQSWPSRFGWQRAGIYAGLPLAEAAVWDYIRDMNSSRSLNRMIEEHARRVGPA